MAIVSETTGVKMITRLNYGMVEGEEVIKNKTYSNIRASATAADIYQIAGVIGDLQVPALETVSRSESALLYDDGL